MFTRREAPVPKSWAAEIALRRGELEDAARELRMMLIVENDPALRALQLKLIEEAEEQARMVIPPEELGMKLERLAR